MNWAFRSLGGGIGSFYATLVLAQLAFGQAQETDQSIRIALRPPLFAAQSGPTPIEIRKIQFLDTDWSGGESPVAIDDGDTFRVRIDWRRANAGATQPDPALPEPTEVRFRLTASGPSAERTFALDLHDRKFGATTSREYSVRFPRMQNSGRGTLYIETLAAGVEREAAIQWAQPFFISPVAVPSNIDQPAFRSSVGADVVSLGQSFRLGPGASIELDVRDRLRRPVHEVGLISFTNYDNESTVGEAVATVVLLDANGGELTRTVIRSGLSTSKRDFDEYPAGFLSTRRISIFDSQPAERVSRFNQKAYSVHRYAALLRLDNAVTPARIRLEYARNYGILHVADLALTPAWWTR